MDTTTSVRHPRHERDALLRRLASQWGQDLDSLLAGAAVDDRVPGICAWCAEYSTEVEPDLRTGYCEHCGHKAVTSCLVLAGIL